MPRTPEPEADGLDAIPSPPAVFHIEQALLGALLLDPRHLDDVTGIVPASFSTAAHTALFAAIGSLPAPDPVEHSTTTKWLDQVVAAARDQARGLSTLYVQNLIRVCPSARHAPAYARIVEAEHSRRRLASAAQRLMRTARDISLPQRVATTLAEAQELTAVVDDISARFPPHAGSLPRTPAPPPATCHDEEALDEERLLLATSTAHANSVSRMRWLAPGDFTHSLHAGLWQCLTALTRRGTPVDPVTVLWEAQHRGLLTTGARPKDLLDLLSGAHGSPEHWGERILQRSVLMTAHHTGRLIEAFTDDPATTPYQLVTGSRRALADLSAVRARWQHATSPTPTNNPTRAKATAAPRAGPPRATAPPTARNSR
ncbi:replicative DNA helicase [Streptomyces sp. NBC_00825]|uniref:DnaB-like helicase N-terminal domain-containing protein n=1 Tax=unclassified Streptomyces TaxID=2593676 RepID=UPI002ED3E363|nr:replicative DNA helicase [Streptomyces sp. NBC_00826]WTH89278.1 replicative DNA helicase [Streptomyces sp. NBC_00825]WTH98003.1 replicative DNA helicase [Streptomyces sp. NBC_00822]